MYSHEQEKYIMTMTLYHGTDAQYLDDILKNGIVPRGTSKGNWQHADLFSNPNMIYLTDCYAFYYSAMQVTDNQKDSLVLKIEVDENDLCCDEDILMQVNEKDKRVAFEKIIETNKKLKIVSHETSKWSKFKNKDHKHQHRFFSNYIHYFKKHWEFSLEHLGCVGHIGKIEPHKIKDYVVHDMLTCFWSHDNQVTLENHKVKGDYQRAELKYLFDEPMDDRDRQAIKENEWKQEQIRQLNLLAKQQKELDLSKSEMKLLVNN
jgi:uncharacterized protein YnzC (UPF0291/DUF896 family)